MIAGSEFECVGRVRVGRLSPATLARVAGLGGEWLELAPEEEAVVVRHVQPGGAPAPSAVPSELIAILDALSDAERDAIAGGTLLVRDRTGTVMRVVVERGEIRIQWPREDWQQAVPVDVEAALAAADPFSARVSGHLALAAPAGTEGRLIELVDRFEGLYPAGHLEVLRDGDRVRAELAAVNVGPAELLAWLRAMADPASSLDADLEISSFVSHSGDRDFRLTVRAGKAQAERPALFRER